jgi:hypothetical protein
VSLAEITWQEEERCLRFCSPPSINDHLASLFKPHSHLFLSGTLAMRAGRSSRADAITNSPFVRALIRPVASLIAPQPELPPPTARDLISTQPPPASFSTAAAVNGGGGSAGQKRKREEDAGEEGEDAIVNYTAENLPVELKKCKKNTSICV